MKKVNWRRLAKKIEAWFLKHDGSQRSWFVIFGVFLPIFLTIVFSVWGIKISLDSADNREEIESLSRLIRKSQQQIDVLQKIYVVSDNMSQSTSKLKDLPEKISRLSSTLDSLNLTLANETKRVSKSYKDLNETYSLLIKEQKDYLEKISRVVDLTNQQVSQLQANNNLINKEFSRRSSISVQGVTQSKDSLLFLDSFLVYNFGNIEFDIEAIDFEILNSDVVCEPDLSRESDWDLILQDDQKIYRINNRGVFKNKVSQGRGLKIRFQRKCYTKRHIFDVKYIITYTNKYENKTLMGLVQF